MEQVYKIYNQAQYPVNIKIKNTTNDPKAEITIPAGVSVQYPLSTEIVNALKANKNLRVTAN